VPLLTNSNRYNLTALQAEEFLGESVKHLTIFRDSAEFGWDEVQKDVRKMIKIKSKKWGTINSIKSYPSALHGDGKINILIVTGKKGVFDPCSLFTFTLNRSLLRRFSPQSNKANNLN